MFEQQIISEILEKGIRSINFKKDPQGLYKPIEYTFEAGGKHIRPRLCLTSFNLFSDNITQETVYVAMALEIFHQFTLLHDDIMDKSDTRRGRPTVHVRYGDNSAILSGDLMSILAYEYLGHCPAKQLPRALKLFTDMAKGVCEGQQKDMDFEDEPFITMDEYIDMISLKTGVLIGCSTAMGALLAEAGEARIQALYDFGMNLGIAFQISDDYLDTFGDPKIFGKPIGGDIANNKKSWLLVETLRRAVGREQKQRLEAICSMDESSVREKIEAMTNLYIDLGVRDDAVKAISEYSGKAVEALVKAGFSQEQLERMKSISDSLIHREK